MASMKLEDVKALIKEIAGEAVSDMRDQVLESIREEQAKAPKWIDQLQAQKEPSDAEKGNGAARYVRALAAGKGDPEKAARIAKEKFKDERLHKSLMESNFDDGGAIVPVEYSTEIIELLRARAVVRASGAIAVPMNSGSLTLPRQTGAGSANYIGETQNIPPSQQTFGQINLTAKKLAALTPVSNDLIRDSSPQADEIVREDLLTVMSLREDLAFLRDDGTEFKPKGLRHWAKSDNIFASTGSTLADMTADLSKACRLLEEGHVPMTRLGWIMTPRTKWALMQIRDGNGNLVYQPEMSRGVLMGFPFRVTTQIPNNLGGGSNESEIYFGDFSQAIIGENTQIIIEVFNGGAFFDGSNVVSGISSDQTVVRTIARHDFGVRHTGAFTVINEVDWGV